MKVSPARGLRIAFQHVLPRSALLYIKIACCIEYMNTRLVFYPTREIEATPEVLGLAYEDVTIPTADGVRIAAWYVPADRAAGTVLFCHGNAGNISHRLDTIDLLHRLGVNVLIFDYRGYGRSEGSPTEAGTCEDAEAAWQYLVRQRGHKPERIVIHGRSLGGSVAAHLARERPPAGLIVESSFHDITELGAELYPWLPVRWISRLKYTTAEYVGAVKCPVLVVHSADDELIPYHHGRKVFAAARQPKRFVALHGSHNAGFLDSDAIYRPAVRQFLAECLGR